MSTGCLGESVARKEGVSGFQLTRCACQEDKSCPRTYKLPKLTASENRGPAGQICTHHCNAELGNTEGLAVQVECGKWSLVGQEVAPGHGWCGQDEQVNYHKGREILTSTMRMKLYVNEA
jgi:hypothetical protein